MCNIFLKARPGRKSSAVLNDSSPLLVAVVAKLRKVISHTLNDSSPLLVPVVAKQRSS